MRESQKYFEIPLGCFLDFFGSGRIRPKHFGLGQKQVQATKFRKKVSFACKISACKWLCGRFQGGRRKSNLVWPEVKRGWERSRYFREDLAWWSKVVASPEVGENEGESKADKGGKSRKKMVFCQFFTLISSYLGNGIHFYL